MLVIQQMLDPAWPLGDLVIDLYGLHVIVKGFPVAPLAVPDDAPVGIGRAQGADAGWIVVLQGPVQEFDQIAEDGLGIVIAQQPDQGGGLAVQRAAVVGLGRERQLESLDRLLIVPVAEKNVALANFEVARGDAPVPVHASPDGEHDDGQDNHQDDEALLDARIEVAAHSLNNTLM